MPSAAVRTVPLCSCASPISPWRCLLYLFIYGLRCESNVRELGARVGERVCFEGRRQEGRIGGKWAGGGVLGGAAVPAVAEAAARRRERRRDEAGMQESLFVCHIHRERKEFCAKKEFSPTSANSRATTISFFLSFRFRERF